MCQKFVVMCAVGLVLCGCEGGADDELSEDELVDFRSGGLSTTGRLNSPAMLNGSTPFASKIWTSQCHSNVSTNHGHLNITEFSCDWSDVMAIVYNFTKVAGGNVPRYRFSAETWFDSPEPESIYTSSDCTQGFVVHKGSSLSNKGEVSYSPNSLLLACSTSAAGKAALWGHGPWRGYPRYEAAIRVVRADYCGNGNSHTNEGTVIHFLDNSGPDTKFTKTPGITLEAVWGYHGALCLNTQRRWGDPIECDIPTCGELGDALIKYTGNVFAVTRLAEVPAPPEPMCGEHIC